jgi:HEAT repeats
MSKSVETVLGYCAVPLILAHVGVGFMLMIAAIFMGIPDFIGVEVHGLVSFPIFLVAIVLWVWAGLCSLTWIVSGVMWFPSAPRADFRLTFIGAMGRLAVIACGWFVVLGLLALVPADRNVMIQPLSLFGEPAVPLATWFVHDSSPRVRTSAIEVLRRIGPPARSSAPEIAKHLDDPDEQVRLAAHSALRILNPQLLPP